MKGQIAVLEEQARSAKLSSRHYQERMESMEKELLVREKERAEVLKEKTDLDTELAQAEKVQEAADRKLQEIQQRIATVRPILKIVKARLWHS